MNSDYMYVLEDRDPDVEPELCSTFFDAVLSHRRGKTIIYNGELVTDESRVECYWQDIRDLYEALKLSKKDDNHLKKRVKEFVSTYINQIRIAPSLPLNPSLINWIQKTAEFHGWTAEQLIKRMVWIFNPDDLLDVEYTIGQLTPHENEAFHIIRGILAAVTDSDRIYPNMRSKMCDIMIDGRYFLCRVHYTPVKKALIFVNEDNQSEEIELNKVADIGKYSEKIISYAKRLIH